jgi:hypothetical protein
MKKDEIKDALEKGYIRVRVMFEVLGSPKEHVEGSLKKYMVEVKSDPHILLVSEEYAEPMEKDGLWTTFCEADLLVLGLEKLSWLCVNYTPASIEVIDPPTLTYRNKDLNVWLNDILSKLHEVGIITKAVNQKNKVLERNLSVVVRNCVLAVLQEGKSPKELEKVLGIPEENALQFLQTLESEGKVVKKGKKYAKKEAK